MFLSKSGIYIQNLLDNYVSGYPVLICAALESFVIGWVYGINRLRSNLKMMLGSNPNIYWVLCFKILTPIFTIVK